MVTFRLDFDTYLDKKRLTKMERLEKNIMYSKIIKVIKEAVTNKITINHQLKTFLKENLSKEEYNFFTNDVASFIGYSKDTVLFFKR